VAAVTPRYDAVIFDLFGTLVYEFPRSEWDEWLDASAAVLEVDRVAYHQAWSATAIDRQTGRVGDMGEHVRTLAARAGGWPEESQVAEVLEMRTALYRKWFEPRAGALEIVGEMRDRGMPTALISMCAPDTPALWRSSPFAGLLDVEVFSCEVSLRKPEPEIYLKACQLLGVEASRCFYVGDGAYSELSGATAVGMTAVLIRDPADADIEALRPEAEDWEVAIADLRDIAALVFE
jgi:putative hydrolase of the HAD superfamily